MRGRIEGRGNNSEREHPAVDERAKGSRFNPERKIRKTIKRRRFLHNIARHIHGTHVNRGERLKGERLAALVLVGCEEEGENKFTYFHFSSD